MKKLLELLGIILITNNAAGPLVANKPNNNNDKIKNSLETLTRQKRQAPKGGKGKNKKDNPIKSSTPKPQNEQPSTSTTDNQVEFIEKEIALNGNYAKEIKKMLKDFMKNGQVDPLRMINNEGIVATDYYETDTRKKERDANIKIIEKLDAILELEKFDASKIRILILTLKNSEENKEIKLVINLDNFYVQGFINKDKDGKEQYFYFKEEKTLEQWNQEITNFKKELEKWTEEIEKDIKSLDLEKFENNKDIIKKIDQLKEQLKSELGNNFKENKEKIDLLNKNLFDQIILEDSSKLNELKEKVQTLNQEKIYLDQNQEEVNIYQKIQQNKQDALKLLKNMKLKKENEKEYEEKIKNYQWDNVMINKIISIIESNINTIQHKKIKENKINEEIIKQYSINTKGQNKLNYNGSYQNKGLNTVNQNIIISQNTLKDAIEKLPEVNNNNKQSQETKDNLARMIFVTSEAMRFGSHLKYFNYEKAKKSVEFKNIPEDIQNIINSTNDDIIQWKKYEEQLIGGWKAASEDLEQKRKDLFSLIDYEITYSEIILDYLKDKNNNFEVNIKSDQHKDVIEKLKKLSISYPREPNFDLLGLEKEPEQKLEEWKKYWNNKSNTIIDEIKKDIEYASKIAKLNIRDEMLKEKILEEIEWALELKKYEENKINEEIIIFRQLNINNEWENKIQNFKKIGESKLIKEQKIEKLTNTFKKRSLDGFFEKINCKIINWISLNKKCNTNRILNLSLNFFPEEQEKNLKNNIIISIITANNKDLLELIIPKIKDINFKHIYDFTLLHYAVWKNNIEFVRLLLDNGANPDYQDKDGETPLHLASFYGYTNIVRELLTNQNSKNKINVNKKNVLSVDQNHMGKTPLDLAILTSRDEIVRLLLDNDAAADINDYQFRYFYNSGNDKIKEIINNKIDVKKIEELIKIDKEQWEKTLSKISPEKIKYFQEKLVLNSTIEEIRKLSKEIFTEMNFQKISIEGLKIIKNAPRAILIDCFRKKYQLSTANEISEFYNKFTTELNKELENKLNQKIKEDENLLKNLLEKLTSEQKQSLIIKIQKRLEENKEELKKLLKIELSDVIAQTELGEISDNQSETILNRLQELNSHLDINQVKVQENSITYTTATIESIDRSVYSDNTIKVTFTLAKKSSDNPSKKQNQKDESGFGGFKRGFLNPSTKSNINSNTNVSVGEQAGTSGTQNQNTKTTSQNNMYDVPADGSCLFWSVVTSYLWPVRNNDEEFRNRFIQLFGEAKDNLPYIQTLLKQFDLTNFSSMQAWYQDETAKKLVRDDFRNRVVDYIQSHLSTITNRDGELTFEDLIQDNNEVNIENYLIRMRNPIPNDSSTWGGTPEIVAMSNLLNANISVNNNGSYQPINQNATNTINIFHVNGNHYNFALSEQTIEGSSINSQEKTTQKPNAGCSTPTTPKPDTKPIKLPVDDHARHHVILSKNNEDDDANQGNNITKAQEKTTTQLQKDEYHFFDKKTEEKSLKNDENLEINLIKPNHQIKQNVAVVNQPINTNMENLQTTTVEAINQYNALSKEEKLKKLNEINRYYQNLPENDKKAFKEKLTNTGLAALSGGALTAYGTKITVSGAAATSITNAEAMEMTPLLSTTTSTTESLATAETITVAETAAVEGGVIAGETGTAAALAPETLGLSLVIGGLAIAGTWMYFAFHHHETSNIELPTSIHHNVYDNIEKWYKFLAHDKLKIKINKNTWNEIKQNKNSQANIIKIIKNKFVINDHSGWGGSVTNADFNTFVKVIVLHFEQINGYFEILDNENDGFVIITNTEGDWLGIE
ncbi:ankyrin repeat domain-containing protein [Spiroplasma endosymbiont of Clivina fossor]|uniref:ankyrin repeat domain-containing protein n=1 Tax=Spiroplasma endosymbiont of Clivina fossor TaxID=3066282 RepID=UPI00313BD760